MLNELNIVSLIKKYVTDFHQNDLLDIVNSSASTEDFAITINALNLFEFNASFADHLFSYPQKFISTLNSCFLNTFNSLAAKHASQKKCNIRARINGLPLCPEIIRTRLPRSVDVGRFLSVSGTIIRMSAVKMLEIDRQFICNKCKINFPVQADIDQYFSVCKPSKCISYPECENMLHFTPLSKGLAPLKCRSFQELRMQERISQLDVGMMPRSISVILLDDLVDCCKPGDDVTVTGVIMRRWRSITAGASVQVEISIDANHIEINNCQKSCFTTTADLTNEFELFWSAYKNNALTGRNKLLSFWCPQICSMDWMKLIIAMILVGGVQRTDESGSKVRGESHLLMIGDPGTGKSQLLKYISRIMPRAVLTTGMGSTSAGLTCTAVKDGGEWQLEAGALVLSDGGVCCIDEFGTLRGADQASLLEAMEQQTISVAKAGIVCKLDTRCTVVASANPKGQYDITQDVTVNTAIASSLLSRFDLVAILRDSLDADQDVQVSSHLLARRQMMDHSFIQPDVQDLWSFEKIQSYIVYVKSINPALTKEVMRILMSYYKERRKSVDSQASRTTMRLLESLIRLSQGHARLMMRRQVTTQDAIVAVSVMHHCQQSYSVADGSRKLQALFSLDPEEEYLQDAQNLLSRLKLTDILEKEVEEHSLKSSSTQNSQANCNKTVWNSCNEMGMFCCTKNLVSSNLKEPIHSQSHCPQYDSGLATDSSFNCYKNSFKSIKDDKYNYGDALDDLNPVCYKSKLSRFSFKKPEKECDANKNSCFDEKDTSFTDLFNLDDIDISLSKKATDVSNSTITQKTLNNPPSLSDINETNKHIFVSTNNIGECLKAMDAGNKMTKNSQEHQFSKCADLFNLDFDMENDDFEFTQIQTRKRKFND